MDPATSTTLSRSSGERLAWLAAFAVVAALLVLTRFESRDADSLRYATISARLSELPVERWVAPEWWGLTGDNPLSGYFIEHPAGLFFIPAAMGRLGVPAEQAPFIFGVGVALLAVLLLSKLIARLTTRAEGRAALVLLQIIPLAFVFRIRDNHEYPMLVCLLLTLMGLDGVSTQWAFAWLVVVGFAAGLLIKGVFVAFVLLGAGLWILVNPTEGSRRRQIAAVAAALLATVAVGLLYDVWYTHATGGPFWKGYWHRQMGSTEIVSPLRQTAMFVQYAARYVAHMLFHSMPWSLALLWAWWRRPLIARPERQALMLTALFAAATILALSPAGRFAERYEFSAIYLVAAAGVVAAYRVWPIVPRTFERLDQRVPCFPAGVWFILVAARLFLGR